MNGYEYASFIRNTCNELHELIGVTPVMGHVYREARPLPPRWDHVLCHPDDKGKTDEKDFIHPYRDI